MRIAALYDIHGNLPALEAVLTEVDGLGVDRIVIGGDVVPGPMPRDCIAALLALETPTEFIRGNGDREIVARMRGIETGTVPPKFRAAMGWVADQLGPEDETLLDGWASTLGARVADVGGILFCHATPFNDTDIFTVRTPEAVLVERFQGVDAEVLVCGHTHMQFDRDVAGLRVVNAGSVGMPFGEPGAYWLLIDRGIRPRRTEYDTAAAAERIRATGYPGADEFAAGNVVAPPSEEQMLEAFAAAELR